MSGTKDGAFKNNAVAAAGVDTFGNVHVLNTDLTGTLEVTLTNEPTIDIGIVDQGLGGTSAWKVDGSAVTQPVSVLGTLTGLNFPTDPTNEFLDTFDAAVEDTALDPLKWTSVTGGSGRIFQGGGRLSIDGQSGASSFARVTSVPTFTPRSETWIRFSAIIQVETSPYLTHLYRFWGYGTSDLDTATRPIANGIGFEIDTLGDFNAVIWHQSEKKFVQNLPSVVTDGKFHRIYTVFREDQIYWYVDSISTISASTNPLALSPILRIRNLPITLSVYNDSTIIGDPGVTDFIQVVGSMDHGRNGVQIVDGTYPFRKLSLASDGSVNVHTDAQTIRGNIVDSGSGIITFGTQRVVLATDQPTVTIGGSITAAQGTAGVQKWLVDGSGVTQPVSGTLAVTQSTSPWVVSLASTTITGTVGVTQSTSPWVISGTVTANAGSGTFLVDGSASTQPVSAVSLPLPTGASTEATLALIKAKTDNLDVLLSTRTKPADTQTISGTVTANIGTSGSLALDATLTGGTQKTKLVDTGGTNVASISAAGALKVDGSAVTQPVSLTSTTITGTVAATQSGTWTVQPGNTANTTAWKVDGSAVTQPVSGTITANAGSGNFTVTQATGTNLHAVLDSGTVTSITNTVTTSEAAPTTIFNGKTTVTTAGTRVTLAASTTVKSITVKALAANTGTIYVGNTTVAAANGFALASGDSVSFDLANLNTVNLDSSVNGEGVTYFAVN